MVQVVDIAGVPSILAVHIDKNNGSDIMIWKKYSTQHGVPSVSQITRTKQAFWSIFLILMCLMSLAFLFQNIIVSSSNPPKDDNEFLPDAAYRRDIEMGGPLGRGYNPHTRCHGQCNHEHHLFNRISDDLDCHLNHASDKLNHDLVSGYCLDHLPGYFLSSLLSHYPQLHHPVHSIMEMQTDLYLADHCIIWKNNTIYKLYNLKG